jgi:hypothetical protein
VLVLSTCCFLYHCRQVIEIILLKTGYMQADGSEVISTIRHRGYIIPIFPNCRENTTNFEGQIDGMYTYITFTPHDIFNKVVLFSDSESCL